MIYFIAFLSWFCHIVSKVLDKLLKNKKEFNPIIWITDPLNYLYVILSFLTVLTLILSIDYKFMIDVVVYGITFKLSYVASIVIGWTSASIIRAILKKFKGTKKK